MIHAESMVLLGSAVVEQNLGFVEVFGDTLIEKVIYNLLDNAIRHGEGVTRITCGYMQQENSLVWFVQDDGIGIPDEQKDQLFRVSAQNSRGTGLYLAYQVLSACGMQIVECGTYGTGARFEITIPNGLYRFVNMHIPKTEPVLPDISQPIPHPC